MNFVQVQSYANRDPARERVVEKHVLILVSALPGRLVLGLDLSRLAQRRGNTQITSCNLTTCYVQLPTKFILIPTLKP